MKDVKDMDIDELIEEHASIRHRLKSHYETYKPYKKLSPKKSEELIDLLKDLYGFE